MPDHVPETAETAETARHPGDGVLRLGRIGWAVVGIAAAAVVVYAAVSAISGLAVPLVVAAVLGVLLHPLVDRLERLGLRRGLGSLAVLVALIGVLGLAVWVTADGVVDQSAEITDRLGSGLDALQQQLAGTTLDLSGVDLSETTSSLAGGVATLFGSVFSSAAAFVVGTFVAVFFLFYVMADWPRIEEFARHHASVRGTPGRVVVDEATTTLRRYFGALTSSSLVTAVLIGIAAILLDVPLAFSIALVTFVTSYIPYLGAIFSGAFAVLIALGSQGPTAALVLLGVILVVQNVVQTLMLTKLSSDQLRLHPIVNLGSTIVGALLAGLLGAMLSAPVTVMVRDVLGHARRADVAEDVTQG
ncbi:AI-2E family transporter [Krasilnikoviella flava]|uniref:Predicted PurR-regulated permease PerM n=1 Tax=Krasilnikoviella flava TaxID=526729 RepID=A0A1T5K736_9MICO|nr:AI-2E family transporter [Krasilnikoviella flava]SKC59526.1 Predicted PurR-regulated permease PerM [Krasilnikoviella flava]